MRHTALKSEPDLHLLQYQSVKLASCGTIRATGTADAPVVMALMKRRQLVFLHDERQYPERRPYGIREVIVWGKEGMSHFGSHKLLPAAGSNGAFVLFNNGAALV